MPLRELRWQDLIPVSKLLAAAFEDEAAFGEMMHPYRKEYPDDMYLYFLRELRVDYYQGPAHRFLVTYKTEEGKERITGYAYWKRRRTTNSKPGLYNRAMMKTMETYNYLENFIYPNRAMEPSKANLFELTAPFTEHFWSGSRAEVWYLSHMGVDPAYQKQGYGR